VGKADLVDCDTGLPSGARGTTPFVSPDIATLYPEYLADPAILICPSNARYTVADLKDPRGNWIAHVPCANKKDPRQSNMTWGTGVVFRNYLYWGWLMDKTADSEEPKVPVGSVIPRTTLTEPIPMQLAGVGLVAILRTVMGTDPDSGHHDVDFGSGIGAAYAGYGNGGGNTVLRLKEGIERILITDINNAAASGRAQSEVWVMSDKANLNVSDFNHVPGGGNILYMDGHVEFVKYPGPPPISRGMGALFGAIYQSFIQPLE
jgi:prepilin-type processing-associated H-X9-DG protein